MRDSVPCVCLLFMMHNPKKDPSEAHVALLPKRRACINGPYRPAAGSGGMWLSRRDR
jgi:hypothetical protein